MWGGTSSQVSFPAGSAWIARGATVSFRLGSLSVRTPRFPLFCLLVCDVCFVGLLFSGAPWVRSHGHAVTAFNPWRDQESR